MFTLSDKRTISESKRGSVRADRFRLSRRINPLATQAPESFVRQAAGTEFALSQRELAQLQKGGKA
jgi:hypothetical protein